MLKTRVITGVLLAGSFLFVLLHPNAWLFYGFCALAILLATWEWSGLCEITGAPRIGFLVLVFLATGLYLLPAAPLEKDVLLRYTLLSSIPLWAALAVAVLNFPRLQKVWDYRAVKACLGFLVLMQAWAGVIFLRQHDDPSYWIVLVIAIVALSDIGAYFAGRRFGKRKLAMQVSPGKTWAGYVGGLITATLICFFAATLPDGVFFSDARPLQFIAVIILISSMSVLGDLSMSMFKRVVGVKDSGSILPGHGGVLDRIDGMLAAVPIFAFLISVLNW